MRYITTHYRPEFEVELSVRDIEILTKCADSHYDGACRDQSAAGGRFIGWKNMLGCSSGGVITVILKWREVDIMCKTLELVHLYRDIAKDGWVLFDGLYKLLAEENKKSQLEGRGVR